MVKNKQYIELELPVSGFNADALSGLLFLWGCLGIVEKDEKTWIVYFSPDYESSRFTDLVHRLKKMNSAFDPERIKIQYLPHQNWNDEWKKYFKPFAATPGIWIRPPWEALLESASGMEIIIDPQMAFGTGHHETTRLMLQCMEQFTSRDKDVLDVGTGSGILSIAAAKMGARSITAIDIDKDAIENAAHNFQLNGVENVELLQGDIEVVGDRQYDLILANINLETILRLAYNFLTLLKPGGFLIISGILITDYDRVSYIYLHTGLELIRKLEKGEWMAMIWERLP